MLLNRIKKKRPNFFLKGIKPSMETTEFIEPWFQIEEYPESNKGAMEEEAEKEIATGHPLYGKKIHAIARR